MLGNRRRLTLLKPEKSSSGVDVVAEVKLEVSFDIASDDGDGEESRHQRHQF